MAQRLRVRKRRLCVYSLDKNRVFRAIETTRILLQDTFNNNGLNCDPEMATLERAAGISDEIDPGVGYLEHIN
jgi:hypothetical protein